MVSAMWVFVFFCLGRKCVCDESLMMDFFLLGDYLGMIDNPTGLMDKRIPKWIRKILVERKKRSFVVKSIDLFYAVCERNLTFVGR